MNNRLDYLDSIRGVAALMVVIHHLFETYLKYNESQYPLIASLFETINLGRMGVIVFFITSGFVIPWSLNPSNAFPIRTFIIKRFFRLYPVYWFSIFAALIVGMGVGVNIISFEQVLVNFTMIHKYLGYESVIESYWTLHLELVFYVLCGIMFYFGLLQKNQYYILLVVAFSVGAVGLAMFRFYFQIKVPVIMAFGIASMFYGALLRNYFIDNQKELRNALIILTLFYFACVLLATQLYYLDGWLKWFLSHLLAFIFFFILITKVKLTSFWAIYTGRISYSLYLLHSLVIGFVFHFLGDLAYTTAGFYFVILLVLVISIVVSDLSYRFIEKPSVILGRKYKFEKVHAI